MRAWSSSPRRRRSEGSSRHPKQEFDQRRAFTLEKLRLIYSKCPDDFWRFAVTAGFYTGQRLGDLICLAWVAVDLDGNVLRLKQRKTKHKVQVPIRPALRTLLVGLRSKLGKVNPSDPIWPEHAERYERLGAGPFSNEFYDLMTSCGLVPARTHKVVKRAKSKAGSQSRQLTPISFHSLRHTFISLLRATGGNQAVAKELAGHSSDAVNDLYTHMPAETLQRAIAALPEISSS